MCENDRAKSHSEGDSESDQIPKLSVNNSSTDDASKKELESLLKESSDWPQGGHIPKQGFFKDGKIVTKPGLRNTGWFDPNQ